MRELSPSQSTQAVQSESDWWHKEMVRLDGVSSKAAARIDELAEYIEMERFEVVKTTSEARQFLVDGQAGVVTGRQEGVIKRQ